MSILKKLFRPLIHVALTFELQFGGWSTIEIVSYEEGIADFYLIWR